MKNIFNQNSIFIFTLIKSNMNYNDFPILNNNEYTFLNEQFQKTKFNRKDILTEACTILNLIVNVNLSNKEKFNNKISIAINKAIETSNKWLNNFSSQFSIKTQCSNISTMTVFSVLKKFNNLTTKLLILMKNETKEYNK